MPSTDAPSLTKAAADEMQAAAQGAVVDAVQDPTAQTRTITGTLQAASQTTPIAAAATLGSTAGQQFIGNFADLPELAAASWLATWLFQGVKHHHLVNQDKHKWFILPVLVLLGAFGIALLSSHGDLWLASAHAFRCSGPGAYLSSLNYHLAKPLGIFSSAADIAAPEGAQA